MGNSKQLYNMYEQVPYYRKQWFFWLMFFTIPPIAIGILLSGEVYYQKNYKLISFGVANRIAAGFFAVVILYGVYEMFGENIHIFGHMPKCDSSETLSLLSQLVSQSMGPTGIGAKNFENIRIIDINKDTGIVSCAADVQLESSIKELASISLLRMTYKYKTQYALDGKLYVELFQ